MVWPFIIIGPILALIGLWAATRPRDAAMLFQGWKYSDPDRVQLSDAYVASIRLGGFIKILAGVGLLILGIVNLVSPS
jgi:uncharacterized membrane-anchored protein